MTVNPPIRNLTLADLHRSLGEVPLERICMDPLPGTATEGDLLRLSVQNNTLYELIDGTLVEKAMGNRASFSAGILFVKLSLFIESYNLGYLFPADGMFRFLPTTVREPDLCFIPWDRVPASGFPNRTIDDVIPTMAVESLSPSNTRKEMKLKREVYFKAGVELVWMLDPDKETVDVYTSETDLTTLTINDTLDGGTVLPGFSLPISTIFTLPQRPETTL